MRFLLLLTLLASALAARAAEARGRLFFGREPDPRLCRRYYIAAEPVQWDYAPTGRDEVCGATLPPVLLGGARQVGKLRYVQYADATFTTRVIENPALGILGPVLRGVVGEFLVVTFLNRTGQPLSIHPHGVRYDKDSEGSYHPNGAGQGASVAPDASFTYVWQLDAMSGPLPAEPSSKGWLYHSHVTGDDEINAGLVGVIIVTDPARARADGTPADVDRELAALFLIFDESGLGAEEKEAYEYVNNGSGIPTKTWAETQQLLEAGSRATINGRVFGNVSGLEANEGERVRWYLFGLGSERDFHTAHWHGQRVIEDGRRRTDVVELLPASMKVADLVADNPGSWLFHCHVADHMREGMYARFTVHPRTAIGADRDAGSAFLGLPAAARSLRFERAVALLDGGSGSVHLRGTVSVFEAFTVFKQPMQVRIGEKSARFDLGQDGRAETDAGSFTVKNCGTFGVVYGGLMEFEIMLRGPDWLGELRKLGALGVGVNSESLPTPVPVVLEVDSARHRAEVRFAHRAL